MRLTVGYQNTNDLFHSVALLFVFFGRLNGMMLESDLAFLMVIGVSAVGIFLRIRVLWNMPKQYLFWLLGFLALYLLSASWAMNPSRTYTNFIATLGRMFVVLYAFSHMNSMDGIRKVVNTFLAAVVLNNIFIMVVFGPSALIEVRTLEVVTKAGNNNGIGMSSAYAIILSWYLGDEQRRKKPLMLVVYAFLLLIVLLTGSKKALLILFLAVALMYFLTHKNKLTVVLVIAAVVAVGYFLLLNVPALYSLIGNRIESMVNGMISVLSLENLTANNLNNTSLNNSDRTRFYMILRGLEWAKERPLLGYGMANYQDLFGTVTTKNMYSHNNYIEILVGMGIVGLCLYYLMYVSIIAKDCKNVRRSYHARVSLMLILLLLVLEIGLVSYLEIFTQITVGIATCLSTKLVNSTNLEVKNDDAA